ncbi:MAG: hypothetical protein M3N08_06245 [Pseudomonadota bacterium]|nr:hypothetical protein [Pseudomonadota bacterium]
MPLATATKSVRLSPAEMVLDMIERLLDEPKMGVREKLDELRELSTQRIAFDSPDQAVKIISALAAVITSDPSPEVRVAALHAMERMIALEEKAEAEHSRPGVDWRTIEIILREAKNKTVLDVLPVAARDGAPAPESSAPIVDGPLGAPLDVPGRKASIRDDVDANPPGPKDHGKGAQIPRENLKKKEQSPAPGDVEEAMEDEAGLFAAQQEAVDAVKKAGPSALQASPPHAMEVSAAQAGKPTAATSAISGASDSPLGTSPASTSAIATSPAETTRAETRRAGTSPVEAAVVFAMPDMSTVPLASRVILASEAPPASTPMGGGQSRAAVLPPASPASLSGVPAGVAGELGQGAPQPESARMTGQKATAQPGETGLPYSTAANMAPISDRPEPPIMKFLRSVADTDDEESIRALALKVIAKINNLTPQAQHAARPAPTATEG